MTEEKKEAIAYVLDTFKLKPEATQCPTLYLTLLRAARAKTFVVDPEWSQLLHCPSKTWAREAVGAMEYSNTLGTQADLWVHTACNHITAWPIPPFVLQALHSEVGNIRAMSHLPAV